MDGDADVGLLGSHGLGRLEQGDERDHKIALVDGLLPCAWCHWPKCDARSRTSAYKHALVCRCRGFLLCHGDVFLCPQIDALPLCDMAHMGKFGRRNDVHRHMDCIVLRHMPL